MEIDINRKRYVAGKYVISSKGNSEFFELAEQAFVSSVDMIPVIDREKFECIMRQQNVPDDEIKNYLANFQITNEMTSQDHPDLEMLSGVHTQFKILDSSK